MMPVSDAVFVFLVALVIAVPSFMILASVANLAYRLARGKFFAFVSVPAALVFGVYFLIWIGICSEGLSRIAITH
jgi:preprotein translocase subunit SecY